MRYANVVWLVVCAGVVALVAARNVLTLDYHEWLFCLNMLVFVGLFLVLLVSMRRFAQSSAILCIRATFVYFAALFIIAVALSGELLSALCATLSVITIGSFIIYNERLENWWRERAAK